jgi:hypothetical protein
MVIFLERQPARTMIPENRRVGTTAVLSSPLLALDDKAALDFQWVSGKGVEYVLRGPVVIAVSRHGKSEKE